ncbi:hypothetical protein CBR_g9049 [Chara braunii]|uniref:Integrase catalytic domain-containing protein n=1 Tax=Chara braunii TaxID=69332 RepID=A0A388KNW4_CHABU|nr:hypothetical protein CBR_g9049 [Chara braunii]|eukprot:GBG71633.1 hypothetical protein CBR_g9049 [Chara braunii]
MDWLGQFGFREELPAESEEEKEAFFKLLSEVKDEAEKRLLVEERRAGLHNRMLLEKRREFDEKKKMKEEGERLWKLLQEQKGKQCKLTLPHKEVLVAASYLEGSATRWLSGLVQLHGYGHDFRTWAVNLKLEDFLKMVEDRWHDLQEAQKATDVILPLSNRPFKSVRDATDAVERLICVPGVRYDPQVLLATYLRCLPMPFRNQLLGEANINMHNFPSFSKKALDLDAKIGHGHQPTTNGRKKTLPSNWKAKGRIMFVDNNGSTIELDDDFHEGVGAEAGSKKLQGVDQSLPQFKKARRPVNVVEAPGLGVKLTPMLLHGRKRVSLRTCGETVGEPVKMPPEIEGVVTKYPDLFEEPIGVVEREVVHAIEIIPGSSIPKGRIYRMSPTKLDELRQQLKELIEKGWIRLSVSPYRSPVLFVPKKGGTLRMCIDYRALNAITVKNREPLPHIDDLLDRVQGCRYFIKIDLKFEYHQIAIRPEDQHKTAFQTRYGLYEFVVMPFSLSNTPGTFQHAMKRIFHDYLDKFVIVYLDDILSFSRTVEEHVGHLDKVLSLLRQHRFKINGKKREFGRTPILYLGHEISTEELKPDDAKVASIRDWPRPQSVTEMRSFLGMTDYYRNFVKNYSTVAAPLTDLTRLDTPWEWTDSKYARLVAMPATAKTEYVIKLFKENWVRDFGLPKSIISDRDVRFTSELWKAAAAEQGTQLQMTSDNHPKANGQAEQLNRAVDWDEKLALIASLYNNAVHSATRVSPNSLLLTFKPRLPSDFLLPENQPSAAPGTLEFAYRYERLMQQGVAQIHKAQAAMIESENKHRHPSTFQVGDKVWVKSSELGQKHGISRKLMPQYFGPWEVLDIVGDDSDGPSYVVQIPCHLHTYPVFHASKLAPFNETGQFSSRRSMLPPTMDGEVDIDNIVDHMETPVPRPTGRGRPPKPKLQYRVWFKHHIDPKEDKWFTREELMQTAPQAVAHYEKLLQKGKRQIK